MAIVSWEKTVDNIDRMIAQLEPEVSKILGKTAMDAFGLSSQTVPVDTGNLKGSGAVSGGGLSWEITYSTDYALYVHEGTEKMSAQPFLRNAAMRQVPGMRSAFAQLEGRLV